MHSLPMPLEFERLPTEAITIQLDDINQAVEFSQNIPNQARQWQTYLNGLGLFVFKNWLEARDDKLRISWENSTIAKPELANLFPVITNLQVDQFKICLITLDSVFDQQVELSRIVVDLPAFVPHFYVLVEVMEEQEQGMIRGVIDYQQLTSNLNNSSNVVLAENWTYSIPIDWFESETNNLLLYLRALPPEAITLPQSVINHQQELTQFANELANLLPQLQSSSTELWQILNWQQASAVLTSEDLREWIYQLQIQSQSHIQCNDLENSNLELTSLKTYLRDRIKLITQPVINVGRWLWGELDEIGEALSWELISLTPVQEFRSPTAEFAAIRSQLTSQGVEIPHTARCGHYNFNLAGNSLRIYAVAWNSSTATEPENWSLFLILGAPAPNILPNNLQFRVSDKTGILCEQQVNPQQVNSYLFAAVAGTWDEKFIVTISISDGVEVTLPTFAFDIRQVG